MYKRQVDYQALKRLVEFQIDNGADFLCSLATTGEAPGLTQEEKDKITELVKDANKGRIKILKYCGGNNTAAVVEEIKNTDWSGICLLYTSDGKFPSTSCSRVSSSCAAGSSVISA